MYCPFLSAMKHGQGMALMAYGLWPMAIECRQRNLVLLPRHLESAMLAKHGVLAGA